MARLVFSSCSQQPLIAYRNLSLPLLLHQFPCRLTVKWYHLDSDGAVISFVLAPFSLLCISHVCIFRASVDWKPIVYTDNATSVTNVPVALLLIAGRHKNYRVVAAGPPMQLPIMN